MYFFNQPNKFQEVTLQDIKAKLRRRTLHEPNRMRMRKIHCSPWFDSAHVKYGVWTGPKVIQKGKVLRGVEGGSRINFGAQVTIETTSKYMIFGKN